MKKFEAKFVKNGNIKVGNMWVFSKLAGSGEINGCKGTCGEYCKGCYNPDNPMHSSCYVFTSYRIYPSVIVGHTRNTIAMRAGLTQAFENLDKQITRARKKPNTIRIHASGEFESLEEFVHWNNLAIKHPDIKFYVYTKCYSFVEQFLKTSSLAKNFYVNISIWHENGIKEYNNLKHHKNVRAFAYVDDFDYEKHDLKINTMCPAYKPNKRGVIKLNHDITCDKCGLCFSNRQKVTGCFDH